MSPNHEYVIMIAKMLEIIRAHKHVLMALNGDKEMLYSCTYFVIYECGSWLLDHFISDMAVLVFIVWHYI